MTAISQYYARVGISVDNTQLKKVDLYLRQVEKRLADFQKKMSARNGLFNINFKFNTQRLEFDVQKAFVEVGKRIKFPIERFVVDKQALRSQVASAVKEAIASVNKNITLNAKVNQPKTAGGRQQSSQRVSSSNFIHAGGAGGAIARYGFEALPVVGGVYGLSQLNQANQNLISSQIAAESVFGQQGKQMTDWFRQQSEFIGFDYLQNLPTFTKFMASSMPLMGGDASKDVFSSFLQFGRTRGATEVGMNRALNAVSQMAAKGQVMQEELKGQLAEAGGFGELPQLFAEAYQIKTGGNLTGAESRAALMDAMQKGKVKSADILPLVSQLMNKLSAGGIEAARKSSTAEQARFSNSMTRLLELFSKSGGERAFANFFRTLTDGANSASPVVRGLTGAFENLVSFIKAPVNLFKDLNEGLENLSKTTKIAEGDLTTLALVGTLLISKWGRVAAMFAGILLVLEDISFGVRGKDSYTKDFIDWTNSLSNVEKTALGLAAAFTAVAAAIIKINNASKDGGGLGDIGKGKDGKAKGVGFLGSLLNNPVGQVVAGAALFSTLTGAPFADGIGGIKSFESRMLLPEEQRLALRNQPINGVFPMGYSPVDFADRVVAVGDKTSMYYNNPRQYDLDKAAGQAAANQPVNISFGDIKVELPPSADGSTATADQAATFANMIQTKLQDAMSAYTRK